MVKVKKDGIMKKRYAPFSLVANNLPNTRHAVGRSKKYFDTFASSSERSKTIKKQVGVGEMMYVHDNVLGHYQPMHYRFGK
jgi:hypothetical protein